MKHVTFANKDFLLGDVATDLVMEYTILLSKRAEADSVTVNAFGADGNAVEVTLLMDQGTVIVAETSLNNLPDPENPQAEAYLRERVTALTAHHLAQGVDVSDMDTAIEELETGTVTIVNDGP